MIIMKKVFLITNVVKHWQSMTSQKCRDTPCLCYQPTSDHLKLIMNMIVMQMARMMWMVWSICSHEVGWTQDRDRAITPVRSNINAAYIVTRVQRDMFTTQLLV